MLENLPGCLTRWDDGEIVLTGHRINLYSIVRIYKREPTALQVAAYYDLPVEEIEPVISFYHERQGEVDAYFDDYKATLDRQYEEWKNSPAGRRGPTREELLRRLAERGHTIKVELGPEFDRPI